MSRKLIVLTCTMLLVAVGCSQRNTNNDDKKKGTDRVSPFAAEQLQRMKSGQSLGVIENKREIAWDDFYRMVEKKKDKLTALRVGMSAIEEGIESETISFGDDSEPQTCVYKTKEMSTVVKLETEDRYLTYVAGTRELVSGSESCGVPSTAPGSDYQNEYVSRNNMSDHMAFLYGLKDGKVFQEQTAEKVEAKVFEGQVDGRTVYVFEIFGDSDDSRGTYVGAIDLDRSLAQGLSAFESRSNWGDGFYYESGKATPTSDIKPSSLDWEKIPVDQWED